MVFKCFAQSPGCFLDVGANFGKTLIRILSIDRTRDYVGLDPNIQYCAYLDALIFRNGLSKHRVLPIALSNSSGLAQLHVRDMPQPGEIMGTSSIVAGFRPRDFYTTTRTVVTARGDDIVSQLHLDQAGISAIKIDVEGAEDEVVNGFIDTLRRFRPPVFHEVLPNFIVATRQSLGAQEIQVRIERLANLNKLFDSVDYRPFMICEDNALRPIERLSPPVTIDLSMTNHISVPRELAHQYY